MSGLNNGLPQGFTLDSVFKWRYVSGNINYVMDWVCKLYVYIITERKREREREAVELENVDLGWFCLNHKPQK
jgi:hypothetical protein